MRSRQVATAAANCSSSSSAIAVTCRGELISTSCAPVAGREEKRSGSPARREASSGSPLLANDARLGPRTAPSLGFPRAGVGQRRVEVRHDPGLPAGAVGRAAAGARARRARAACGPRGPRRRGSSPAPVARSLGVEKLSGRSARPGARIVLSPLSWSMRISGALRSGRGADRRAADGGSGGGRLWALAVASPARPGAADEGSSRSIGSGKTTVVLWLLPISSSVCR